MRAWWDLRRGSGLISSLRGRPGVHRLPAWSLALVLLACASRTACAQAAGGGKEAGTASSGADSVGEPGSSGPSDARETPPAPAEGREASSSPPGETGVSPEDRFRRAGAAYEAGRYGEAAAGYEALLAEGYDDPRVHYNLGNARFKEGRLGPSILSYERSLARDPYDPDSRENLAYANLLITDKVGVAEEEFPAEALRFVERYFGPRRAVPLLALLSLAAGALALPLWFVSSPGIRRFLTVSLGVLLPLLFLTLCAAALGIARPGDVTHAIVMAASADGRSAPAADGTVLFTVHEGLKVEIHGERPGWLQVRFLLPNGAVSVGWIESHQAERV